MDSPFLSLVACDLLKRFGTDLANVAVIFPGRRARLFFNNYLYQHAGKPVWAPRYFSIDELFQQASGLAAADNILLVSELYKTYIDVFNAYSNTPSTETLDEFFFFGEILLNDFDDIDKNLVNARSLFSNLEDLNQLRDDFEHLTESQIETLSRYFKQSFQQNTNLQQAFLAIWNLLGPVYASFKEKLKAKNIAYPGMLAREAIENETAGYPLQQYVFVGFNVLNKCEEKLFKKLKHKGLFYWDYDRYYMGAGYGVLGAGYGVQGAGYGKSEAGRFIMQNIQKFGSALPSEYFDNFNPEPCTLHPEPRTLHPKLKITIISSPSETAQSACIPAWIDTLRHDPAFTEPDSAIVLCNESILPTVMHAIPPKKVENVNITMGFPINQTPVISFLQVLTDLQVKGYVASAKAFRYKQVLAVLRHPYTQMLFPEATDVEKELTENNIFLPTIEILRNHSIFQYAGNTELLAVWLIQQITKVGTCYADMQSSEDLYAGLYQESIFRAYQVINRLYGLLQSGDLEVDKTTFLRLMKKLFSTTKIPFHGEPVKGLQIMGLLETRNLDFKNLILLSVNEGFMPGTNNDNTFIPQFIRKYFELNTIEHQDSVYAYYFYRLIQRAENITLVYNTDQTQTGKAEISRFLLQLLIESGLNIQQRSLQTSIRPIGETKITVQKDEALLNKIRQQYDLNTNPEAHRLSPSALNTFIDCSLKFYFQYIEGLKAADELSDELDSSVFGTIFHKAAELLYKKIGGVETIDPDHPVLIRKEQLELFLKTPPLLEKIVAHAFSSKFFKNREVSPNQYNGEQLINFRVINHLLRRLISYDAQHTPFYICGLEFSVQDHFDLPSCNAKINVGGIIDRLDQKENTLRIVDYKTSGSGKPFKTLDDLTVQTDKRASHVFQLFTYASVLIKNGAKSAIAPALLYLQEAGKDDYSPVISFEGNAIADFKLLSPAFDEIFIRKIEELFNPDIPFSQTGATGKCAYCDFKILCNR